MELEVDTRAAVSMLDGITDRLEDGRSLLDQLGDDLTEHERDAFDTQGFGTWAPLSPETIARKGSARILVDTGSLLDGLTSPSAVRVSGEGVSVTSDHPGAVHARRGSRGAPPRNPTPTPEARDVERWARSLLRHITGEV